jgi:ABC-type Na+ efflux pump permease subunit
MIFTIFKKELIDTLRDKRTMRTMLLIPLLVFPITLTLFVNVSSSFEKKASEEKLKIGVWGDLGGKYWNQLKQMPAGLGKKELKNFEDSSALKREIKQGEIQLGLIPGGGGSQRLPRLIGIVPSLDLILTGKKVDSKKALKLGIASQVVPVNQLIDRSVKLCLEKNKSTKQIHELIFSTTYIHIYIYT